MLGDQQTVRRLRLACGWVLFTYVSLHLVNHALGNISWQTMENGAAVAEWIWRSPLGTVALYGALYQRRDWRMGWGEASRLLFGFSIVPLLISVSRPGAQRAWARCEPGGAEDRECRAAKNQSIRCKMSFWISDVPS